jgi:DNA-binding beta-propeller fold protein YncE
MSVALLAATMTAAGAADKKDKEKKGEDADPYAEYVWPPPPDEARIQLVDVISGRLDVEAESKWKRALMGASPTTPYDSLKKPFAVLIDAQGRLVVSDTGNSSLVRFDRGERRMDVFGTQGRIRLKTPLGMCEGADGAIYVADAGLQKIIAIDPEGTIQGVFGKRGDLLNPTDVVLSPDGKRLFVADSKAHQIVVLDAANGAVVSAFGKRGEGDGEFSFPTSLAFDADGNLYVVDQMNARVQIFSAAGDYIDQFGARGVGYGNLVRPKDIAIDEAGYIYVSDNAFNNIQIFDADLTLLTFVGEGGFQPGQFAGMSGVAVRGDLFAAVDQLGGRVQLFRYLQSRTGS